MERNPGTKKLATPRREGPPKSDESLDLGGAVPSRSSVALPAPTEALNAEAKFPQPILARLRERKGLEPDDPSRDAAILMYSPGEALEEVVAWEFGDSRWGSTFLRWAGECGFSVIPKVDRGPAWVQNQANDLSAKWLTDRRDEVRDRFAGMTGLEAAATSAYLLRALEEAGDDLRTQRFRSFLAGSVNS